MSLPTFEYTAAITPEHIYPRHIDIPKGYRVRGFRVPASGEFYLDTLGHVCSCTENQKWANTNPRLILNKIPQKRYIFEPVEVTPDTELAYVKSEHSNSFMAFRRPYAFMAASDQFYSLREEEF